MNKTLFMVFAFGCLSACGCMLFAWHFYLAYFNPQGVNMWVNNYGEGLIEAVFFTPLLIISSFGCPILTFKVLKEGKV